MEQIRSLQVQLEAYLSSTWNRFDAPKVLPAATAVGTHATVEVNDGRWIVRCPFCAGAQIAHRMDKRFFCVDCLNQEAGSLWVTVDWPADVQAIETALARRPQTHTRAWLPGETVADLEAQNTENGVL